MSNVSDKHEEFLAYERTLTYEERCARVVAIQAKGLDHNDVEHRRDHEKHLAGQGLAPQMKRLLDSGR